TLGPAPLESITSAMDFETPLVRDLIHALKYEGIKAAAEPLARWLTPVVRAMLQPGDVLIPVPLHRRRQRTRGYNQSQLLADRVGQTLRAPVLQGAVRTRHTKPQVECIGDERRTNPADAFEAQPIDAKRIILVDDVTTTGSTLQEVAQAIRKTTNLPILGVAVGRG
ncbi:MAG: ComF family protein, partial [Patescibacteria group bacterium]